MGFSRRGRQETVTVTSFGEPEQITLRQLSAYDVDQIRIAYPPPLPPQREGGEVAQEAMDAFRRERTAWEERFLLVQLCAQVVEPKFDSDDRLEQVAELCSSRTREEAIDLATKAWMVGRGEVTPQHEEAAKERLTPTESPEPETTLT